MDLFKILGRVTVTGVNEAKDDLENVTDKAEKSSDSMGSAFKKLGKIIATVFAIDKIKDFGVAMVQASANVQAETAQFEASFKDLANEADSMFTRVGDATGVFATRLKTTGTKAFSQLKGAGMDANEALAKTETFLNLASDASAYYDISLEDAEARIRSFMRGNVEAGDAIGLFTSESQRNTYALEMYGKKWLALTEAEKQNLMLGVAEDIYKQSGALGQAQREADGLANVSGNLKETWRQFLAVIGEPVLQAVIPIMQNLTTKLAGAKTWVDNNKESIQALGTNISKVVDVIWSMVEGLISIVMWLNEHKGVTTSLITVITSLVTALMLYNATLKTLAIINTITSAVKAWMIATQGMTIAQRLLNIVMMANPIGLIIAGIGALTTAFIVLWNRCDGFRNFWINLWGDIKRIGANVVEYIKNLVNRIKNLIKRPRLTFNGSINPADWIKGDLPRIGVEWYAKGGVMTEPTVFGYNPRTNSAMVGGEAGDEAIAPISTLQNYIAEAVESKTSNLDYTMNKLLNLLGNYLPDIKENINNMQVVMDTGALVGALAPKMDNKLGQMSNSKARFGV